MEPTGSLSDHPIINVEEDTKSETLDAVHESHTSGNKHSLELVLRWKLETLRCDAIWNYEPELEEDRPRKVQVTFPSMGGRRTERILEELHHLGFGAPGSKSTIWVLPMVIRQPVEDDEEVLKDQDTTITSRLTVQQVCFLRRQVVVLPSRPGC